MKFSELQLHPAVMGGLEALQFSDCTPVQDAAIPHVLAGKDLAGLAQTGTGKTAAYLVPLMDRILYSKEEEEKVPEPLRVRRFNSWKPNHFILILVPTRELAEQVQQNVKDIGQKAGFRSVAIYGGTSYEPQKKALAEGVEFVVATPGRLIDLFKENLVQLGQVRAVVFDEADRMFDMGFKDDMKYILRRIPRERQFLVFSATLNFDVLNVAYEFGAEPVEINVSKDQAKAENVDDELFHVGHEEKPGFLLSLIRKHEPKQAIIFSNFKHNVERLSAFLSANGVPAVGISSLLSQAQRNRVLEQFKAENDRNILVATDVAARGLDIKGVDLVINFELSDDPENYVHRIGRTGRAGARGRAFSLVSDRDVEALSRIEDYLGHKVKTGWLEDTEVVRDHKPFTSEGRNGPRPQRSFSQRDRNGRPERGDDRGRRRPDRPERRHDRPERRPDGERGHERGNERGAERHQQGRGEGVHRDRLTGRHGQRTQRSDRPGGPNSRPQGEARNGDSRGRQHQQSRQGHQQGRDGNRQGQRQGQSQNQNRPYRGGRYRPGQRPATPPSLGQKITGFFKSLFGR